MAKPISSERLASYVLTRQDARAACLTALCIWECMLDQKLNEEQMLNYDGEDLQWQHDMTELFDNVGYYEMRDISMTLQPWVDGVYIELEKHLGEEDTLVSIGMHAFDWEFVPHLMSEVPWAKIDQVDWADHLPKPEVLAATMIAAYALKIKPV